MKITNGVVPVAGLGTRLLPSTKSQPKEMLPVGRKPVVQYVVEEFERSGVNQILFVTGRSKVSIENHFDTDAELERGLKESGREDLLETLDFSRMDLHFFYTRQRQQNGLGDAIMYAEPFAGDQPFVVGLGDSIIAEGSDGPIIAKLAECFETRKAACVIGFEEVPHEDTRRYGIAKPIGSGDVFEVEDLIEKPEVDQAPSNLAIAGRYVFDPIIFTALHKTQKDKRGEIQLTDAIRLLLRWGHKVYGVKFTNGAKRYDIGNFESYYKTFLDFALADEELGDTLRAYLAERLEAGGARA